jgi:pyruvate dehydrogenase E2 component (dihydrolipoamide acetyltransferase)
LLEEQKQKNITNRNGRKYFYRFLGMWYIVEFNSIINQPNSAILSVGAIVENQ